MPGCCETGRNVQKYRGGGGGGTASTLQEALENSNVATIDINLISGANLEATEVLYQTYQLTEEILIYNKLQIKITKQQTRSLLQIQEHL